MGIFKPKECTDEQIADFWAWFEENEEKLSQKEGTKRARLLREAEIRMMPLFPDCHAPVELALMPNGDRWELDIFHNGRPYVKRTAQRIRVLMPASLQGKWRMKMME